MDTPTGRWTLIFLTSTDAGSAGLTDIITEGHHIVSDLKRAGLSPNTTGMSDSK